MRRKSFPIRLRVALAGLLFLAGTVVMRSEGPQMVGGPPIPGGTQFVPGQPFVWTINPITYWTDKGTLGPLSNSSATSLVQSSLQVWLSVPTASINFSQAGQLPQDVTSYNILAVLNDMAACSTPLDPNSATVIARDRTVIFDTDGSAIEALGGDPSGVLGVTIPLCWSSDGTTNFFQRTAAVFNGQFATTFDNTMEATMIHEFGHMIGLDHSQINLECLADLCVGAELRGVPIMFPVAISDRITLSTDDEAGISVLYPETVNNPPNRVPFSTLGRIQGHVYFSDGITPAQGFNVIARNTTDPLRIAVSNVSGFLFTACVGVPSTVLPPPWGDCGAIFGSTDTTLIGVYDLPGLPSGTYTVEVEAINDSWPMPFILGSSVGPIGQMGFQFPLYADCTPLYLGSNASGGCGNPTHLTVTAGAVVNAGTDVILNGPTGTSPRYDAWEDGP